jgi:perosamine synthetase
MIQIAKPTLGDSEIAAVTQALQSGWVSQGPNVAKFEYAFANYVDSEYACAVSNCTTALYLALLAVGVAEGDEVITVSHSFVATANCIRYCGATPVFVDIDPQTYNMDPALLESAISERTKAIICVHQMGMPCDVPKIMKVASRFGLPVIEDAACGIGSEIRIGQAWEKIGKPHGDIACFSFHPRKVITTGEGGMLTTYNPEWDQRFRLLRQHAMSISDTTRHNSYRVIFEDYTEVGFNFRMTDIQAAIGIEQLKRLPEIIDRRRELAARYQALLSEMPELGLPMEPDWARSNWQSFCVRLPEGSDQRQIMQHMLEAGVATRRGIMCSHREPAYPVGTWSCGEEPEICGCDKGRCRNLKHSEEAQDGTAILPLFPDMTFEQQNQVVAALAEALHR